MTRPLVAQLSYLDGLHFDEVLMIKVFFSGYGWWYEDFERVHNELPMVLKPDEWITFPFHDHQDNDRSKPVRTVGEFFLDQVDEIAYLRTNKTTHIKNIYPCPDSDPRITFPKLVIEHAIEQTKFSAEDCIFVIDSSQNPEFVFLDETTKQKTIEPNQLTSTKTPVEVKPKETVPKEKQATLKEPKKYKLRWLIWKVYSNLVSKNKKSTAQAVWDEIRFRHEIYDTDSIIQEVTADIICWYSPYADNPTFKRKTLDGTLTKLRKSPPF